MIRKRMKAHLDSALIKHDSRENHVWLLYAFLAVNALFIIINKKTKQANVKR
jgi:hypothetical protein